MNNRIRYKKFIDKNELPLFFHYNWLNSVCFDNWNVVISYDKNGEIQGVLPYQTDKKMGFQYLLSPILTPYLGVWFVYPKGVLKYGKQSFEKKVINDLINQLPSFIIIKMKFHPSFKNWQPFLWNAFNQTTSYTHIINGLSNLDVVYGNFKSNIKREIKKAKNHLSIESSNDSSLFYKTQCLSFERQKINIPYSFDVFSRIDTLLKDLDQRDIFIAKGETNNIHGVLYIMYDGDTAYYFAGGADPDLRSSGVSSLLMWHAIQVASKRCSKFDFMGSNIESIEKFVSGFGGEKTPFHHLFKSKNKFYKLLYTLIKG